MNEASARDETSSDDTGELRNMKQRSCAALKGKSIRWSGGSCLIEIEVVNVGEVLVALVSEMELFVDESVGLARGTEGAIEGAGEVNSCSCGVLKRLISNSKSSAVAVCEKPVRNFIACSCKSFREYVVGGDTGEECGTRGLETSLPVS